jgi:hypothetical protein
VIICRLLPSVDLLGFLQANQVILLQKRQSAAMGQLEPPCRRITQTAAAEVFEVRVHSPAGHVLGQQRDRLPMLFEPIGGMLSHEALEYAQEF